MKLETFDSSIEDEDSGDDLQALNHGQSTSYTPVNNIKLTCLVCGDVATGRHYGSVACNGCKGFFRRTIRCRYNYECRFHGDCSINKQNRAGCRYCRYMKCLSFGMKIDAVQNERDLIGKRTREQNISNTVSRSVTNSLSKSPLYLNFNTLSTSTQQITDENDNVNQRNIPTQTVTTSSKNRRVNKNKTKNYCFQKHHYNNTRQNFLKNDAQVINTEQSFWESPKLILDFLIKSEERIKKIRNVVIEETGNLDYTTNNEPSIILASGKQATSKNIFHSLYSQLLLVIEWAKSLKPFFELSTPDQTKLLKNFASQNIVLSVAYQSKNVSDSLKLTNNSCIPCSDTNNLLKKDCIRVMDTLVAPMRYFDIDEVEFVALKACVLFNPIALGLENQNFENVLNTRRKIYDALKFYIKQKKPQQPNRLSDLIFSILLPLQNLAKSVSEDVLVTKLSGVSRIDLLMEELILEDTDSKNVNKNQSINSNFESFGELSKNSTKTLLHNTFSNTYNNTLNHSLLLSRQNLTNNNFYCCQTESSSTNMLSDKQNFSNQSSMIQPNVSNHTNMSMHSNYNALNTNKYELAIPSNSSPIHEFEMFSTLSSYVLGKPLMRPPVTQNNVMLSSTCVFSEPSSIISNSDVYGNTSYKKPISSTTVSQKNLQLSSNIITDLMDQDQTKSTLMYSDCNVPNSSNVEFLPTTPSYLFPRFSTSFSLQQQNVLAEYSSLSQEPFQQTQKYQINQDQRQLQNQQNFQIPQHITQPINTCWLQNTTNHLINLNSIHADDFDERSQKLTEL